MNKNLLSLVLLFFISCNAFSQWNVQYRTQVLKQGPDTLKISLQVRWTGAGGSDFTMNQGTIRVRWSNASFANIRSLSAIGSCIVFTGATNGMGYTSSIRQKTAVGSDSAYVISPLALSSAVNSNGWNTPAELTGAGDPDSGFVVTNAYREIAQLKWLVLNAGGAAQITIDNAASGFLTAGRFDNPRNCPSANATNFASGSLLSDDSQTSNTTPLPVELASFVSSVNKNAVTLNWTTISEQNNKGFSIERTKSGNELQWNEVKFVNGAGSSSNPVNYSFEDKNLTTAKYKYRLKQVDFNGNYKYYELQNEVEVGIPAKFEISQNYPNPFNPSTKINFALPNDTKVVMKVYDITGREVQTIFNDELKPAGYYTVDFNGAGLSSGIYIYRIQTDKDAVTKKMALVK
ncbi:MAG: T9SS type A sorting domain-containing protein [Bacteroidetes bacterium]|nr:T9SS type A sorting domain-containing protein [Bacteroidota bacterium]